MIGSKLMI